MGMRWKIAQEINLTNVVDLALEPKSDLKGMQIQGLFFVPPLKYFNNLISNFGISKEEKMY